MFVNLAAQDKLPDAPTLAPAVPKLVPKFLGPAEDIRDAARYRSLRAVAMIELGITEEEFDHGIDKKLTEFDEAAL